jgi:hypothetical protein
MALTLEHARTFIRLTFRSLLITLVEMDGITAEEEEGVSIAREKRHCSRHLRFPFRA